MPTQPTRSDTSLGDGAAPEAGAPGRPAPDEGRAGWSLGRRLGVAALALLGVLALVVVGAVVFLQTEAGRSRVQGVAVGQIANLLAEDAEVTVERLEGNFLTGARLVGLDVVRGGETVVAVDTVEIDYDLTTLLQRRFSADRKSVV